MNITERLNSKLKLIVRSLDDTLINANFYMNHAPTNATTPYIVFRVEDMIDTSPTYNATIKFMCWDDRNKSSITNITNADVIESVMNHGQFSYEDMSIHSTLTLTQNIPSDYLTDKQCIEMQYDTRIYIKER